MKLATLDLRWALLAFIFFGASSVTKAINNDGQTDIYWRNYSTFDDSGWLMNGVSYSSSSSLPVLSDSNWKMVGTGDFNKDGQLDILWRHATTGMNAVWFMSGSTYLSSAYIQPLTDTNWEVAATGYFDGITDKSIDILWRNKVTGDNAIWFMDGIKLLSTGAIQEVPDLNWKIGGTGDFNNDGFTDIVWHHSVTGLNYVWFMQGSSLITTAQIQSASDTNWEIVGTGYFSGLNDNTMDLLWRNKSTGDNAIWQMNGVTYLSSTTLPWVALDWKVGGTGDSKVDTDNDGLADLWEKNYFGNLTPTAGADPDGDGYTNSQEYQNGTDPSIAGSDPRLGEGADFTGGTWTSGGNANWFLTSYPSMRDGSSVRSGIIGDNQTTYMELKIVSPVAQVLVSYWKVSSEEGHDYLRFYKNGSLQNSASGEYDWVQNVTLVLAAGTTNTIRWEYSKDGSGSSGDDCGWVDCIMVENAYGNYPGDSLGKAVDNTSLSWNSSGDNNSIWQAQTFYSCPVGGGESAESGYIPDDAGSQIWTTVTGPGVISFYWKVSSEGGYDFFNFWIFNTPQPLMDQISGEVDWTYKRFFVPSGTHLLYWDYRKDMSFASGLDRAWLDYVRFEQDLDADGLPDSWETQYFGNTTSQKGSDDFDADGLTNLQEYLQGTNPVMAELRVKVSTPRKNSLVP